MMKEGEKKKTGGVCLNTKYEHNRKKRAGWALRKAGTDHYASRTSSQNYSKPSMMQVTLVATAEEMAQRLGVSSISISQATRSCSSQTVSPTGVTNLQKTSTLEKSLRNHSSNPSEQATRIASHGFNDLKAAVTTPSWYFCFSVLAQRSERRQRTHGAKRTSSKGLLESGPIEHRGRVGAGF